MDLLTYPCTAIQCLCRHQTLRCRSFHQGQLHFLRQKNIALTYVLQGLKRDAGDTRCTQYEHEINRIVISVFES